MNLRVPLTGMVLQWTMTIMVNQFAVCTTKFNRTQLLQFAFGLPVNTLWKFHIPNFLNCLCAQSLPVSCVVRYVVANIHSPQNSDWSQIYTLMLKRLGTDLQASTDRIKNSLENGRVVEHQQRYIPNPQYFVPTKYLQGSQLEIAAGEFTNFLTEQISKEAVVTPQLVQTCLELSKTLQCHLDLHNMFVDCVSHQERGQDSRGQIAAGDSTS